MPVSAQNLQQSVEEARRSYITRLPMSRKMSEDATKVLPGGNTRTVLYFSPFPLFFERGEGSHLWDCDGNRYVNLLGEFTAGIFGHSHPVIRQAIKDALDSGINLSGHTPNEMALAELIHERFPSMELMRFTNSGTEANLMAISAARLATGKDAVMVFSGGYHGGVISFGAPDNPMNAPYRYVIETYNDIETTRQSIRKHAADLACVLVEPMMGASGCIPGDVEFLKMLRSETEQAGIVLIFDEVMTSRLSSGGTQQLYGICPDMTTLGKYLGGGMSFGAFGGARRIMEAFDPRKPGSVTHAGTFNNNTLTMAAGSAALSRILTPAVIKDLNARGDSLRTRLNELFSKADAPLRAIGLGSLMNIHAVRGEIRSVEDLKSSNELLKELFFLDMLEQGFYMARRGFIALSLEITDTEIEDFLASVETFLEQRQSLLVET